MEEFSQGPTETLYICRNCSHSLKCSTEIGKFLNIALPAATLTVAAITIWKYLGDDIVDFVSDAAGLIADIFLG